MTAGTIPPIDERELGRIRAEAMDFADIGLYRYRFDGTIVFFDMGALRLLDLQDRYEGPSSIVGADIGTLLEYMDPPGRLRAAMRKHKSVRNLEYRFRTLSGKVRWVYHNSYLVTDRETGEEQVQVIARDITLLKETTLALEASKKRYQALAEESPQGFGVFQGTDARLRFVNSALARLLGESPQDLVGWNLEALIERTHPEERTAMRASIEDAFEGGVVSKASDVRLVHRDGETRWVDASFVPIEYFENSAVQLTLVDNTERRLAEERRRGQEDRMRHTQRLESLGVLAGGIAHDFNNLLAGVLGNADLAARRLKDEDAVLRHLAEINTASRRAAELCRQLLAYSGRCRVTSEPMDFNRLIRDTGELLKVSISKKAVLELQLEANLPPVKGDPSQLKQLLMNLIINASEALGDERGTITLVTGVKDFRSEQLDAAYCGQDLPAGSYVVLEVRDTGVGMDDATCDRIFEPFFTTKFTGRGLGLASGLGIIRGHDGALFVDTQPDCGSSFRVLLPPAIEASEPLERQVEQEDTWRGNGTVLIVDDEQAVRDTAREMLQEMGFDAIDAPDGKQGIEVFRANRDRVSLVLLDVLMPEADGRECFRAIRGARRDVPVVFSSGFGEESVSDLVDSDDRVLFLQKPYGMAALSEVVRKLTE